MATGLREAEALEKRLQERQTEVAEVSERRRALAAEVATLEEQRREAAGAAAAARGEAERLQKNEGRQAEELTRTLEELKSEVSSADLKRKRKWQKEGRKEANKKQTAPSSML